MFVDPHYIIEQLSISQGASVADLGCGIGSYSFALATKVGKSGSVYACEVQKNLLVRMMNEAHDRAITSIHPVHANIEQAEGTRLRHDSMDWVIVVNTLFQIEHRDVFVKEIYRILKPGGSVMILDWSESFGNMGHHPKDIIDQAHVIQLFEKYGFKKTPQVIDAGAHHYAVVFRK